MDPATIALVGTFIGGPVALKIVDWLLTKNTKREESAKAQREELRKDAEAMRKDAASLRTEMKEIELNLDEWRDKYYKLLDEHLVVRARLPKEEEWKEG